MWTYTDGARKVLDAISFDAQKGTFVGIIGPNGSGKTTLLKAISRVIAPTGGIVRLDGQPLFAPSSRELAQSVAVVPQETGPGFDFTVSDVVMMGRYPHMSRLSKEREEDYAICRKAMALTGVTHLSDRSIHAISGGELQRVIIARALASSPATCSWTRRPRISISATRWRSLQPSKNYQKRSR